jgi:aspartate-semialdehyde dehydrogenase
VRVPVFVSHSEAVHVETTKPLSPNEARRAFAAVPGVVVIDDPANHGYPIATQAAGSDDIFVGRVRTDPSVQRGIAFWVVSDNLRKGAATNAVEIAETLLERGWVKARSRRAVPTGAGEAS